MNSRRQDVSAEPISQPNKLTKPECSFPIPADVLIEIFSRLPVKSIARCRCVSKHWDSILRCPDFTDLFLEKSSSRPQLLFAFQNKGELFLFSTSQPQNPDEDSPPLAATYLMKIPFNFSFERFSVINGLVFLRDERYFGLWKSTVSLICKPSTGQCLTLPDVKARSRHRVEVSSYLGYDPVEKQHKVLAMTTEYESREVVLVSKEHQVLSLGTGELSWRTIKCGIRHFPLHNGICVNGVLYYPAAKNGCARVSMIICFDVRTEKFKFIQVKEAFFEAVHDGVLVNYNGKLGALNGTTKKFTLWVLEDSEKEEWSEHTYVFSASCQIIVNENRCVRYVGVTRTNEIVLSPYYQNQTGPFYIYYYNIERNSVKRVEIQGMEAFKGIKVYTLLGYVEDAKLLQMF